MNLQPLIDRNNVTVALLKKRDFKCAMLFSKDALTLLHQQQRMESAPHGLLSTSGAASDCLDQYMLLSEAKPTRTHAYNDDDDDKAIAFVYDYGIAIPSTEMQIEVISKILMFNCALTHQLYGQEHQDKTTSRQYLLKSKRLYQYATEIRATGEEEDYNMLFQFAVVNNTAVIELQIGNQALSTSYFEYLMQIWMVFLDRGLLWSRLPLLRGFLRNVEEPEVQPAPAA